MATKVVKTLKSSKKSSKPVAAKKSSKPAAAEKKGAKSKVGERKLTEEGVRKIKKALAKGHTQAAIVKATGLKRSTVWNIASGNTWADVK